MLQEGEGTAGRAPRNAPSPAQLSGAATGHQTVRHTSASPANYPGFAQIFPASPAGKQTPSSPSPDDPLNTVWGGKVTAAGHRLYSGWSLLQTADEGAHLLSGTLMSNPIPPSDVSGTQPTPRGRSEKGGLL